MEEIKVVNPFTLEESVQLINTKEQVFGIDELGKYVGLLDKGTEYLHVNAPPSNEKFTWNFDLNQWQYIESLEEVKLQALQDIDNLAGATRLQYITSIPGQDAVYAQKLQEAEEYLRSGSVGSYLAIEAETLNKDLNTVANDIINKSIAWNTVIGPQIEGIRRKNKQLVNAAETVDRVYEIKAQNTQDLSILQG